MDQIISGLARSLDRKTKDKRDGGFDSFRESSADSRADSMLEAVPGVAKVNHPNSQLAKILLMQDLKKQTPQMTPTKINFEPKVTIKDEERAVGPHFDQDDLRDLTA